MPDSRRMSFGITSLPAWSMVVFMVLSLPWLIPSANRSLRRAQLAHGGPDSCTLKKMI